MNNVRYAGVAAALSIMLLLILLAELLPAVYKIHAASQATAAMMCAQVIAEPTTRLKILLFASIAFVAASCTVAMLTDVNCDDTFRVDTLKAGYYENDTHCGTTKTLVVVMNITSFVHVIAITIASVFRAKVEAFTLAFARYIYLFPKHNKGDSIDIVEFTTIMHIVFAIRSAISTAVAPVNATPLIIASFLSVLSRNNQGYLIPLAALAGSVLFAATPIQCTEHFYELKSPFDGQCEDERTVATFLAWCNVFFISVRHLYFVFYQG